MMRVESKSGNISGRRVLITSVTSRERVARRFAELDERVGGGWIERKEERAEGLEYVHAYFSEAEGGECD